MKENFIINGEIKCQYCGKSHKVHAIELEKGMLDETIINAYDENKNLVLSTDPSGHFYCNEKLFHDCIPFQTCSVCGETIDHLEDRYEIDGKYYCVDHASENAKNIYGETLK